jgi:hypothetical protein
MMSLHQVSPALPLDLLAEAWAAWAACLVWAAWICDNTALWKSKSISNCNDPLKIISLFSLFGYKLSFNLLFYPIHNTFFEIEHLHVTVGYLKFIELFYTINLDTLHPAAVNI